MAKISFLKKIQKYLDYAEEEYSANYNKNIRYTLEPLAQYIDEEDFQFDTQEKYEFGDFLNEFFEDEDTVDLSDARLSHIRSLLTYIKERSDFKTTSELDDILEMLKISNFRKTDDEQDKDDDVDKALTDQEIKAGATAGDDLLTELIIRGLFDTGCRKQEFAALKPKDIDFDSDDAPAAVKIERAYNGDGGVKETKTGEGERTVEFSERSADLMKQYIEQEEVDEDGFIFGLKDWLIYRRVKQGFTLAQVRVEKGENGDSTKVTPHWLRHNRNTRIKKEHGAETAQQYMGHANMDMTDHYTQFDSDETLGIHSE